MLTGHYAPAYLLKSRHDHVPLWILFIAVQAVDIAFFILVPLGIEQMALVPGARGPLAMDLTYMPWTHSLATAIVLLVSSTVGGRAAGHAVGGWIVGVALASHWLGDLLVHVPDLPLAPGTGTTRLGLGLWRLPLASFVLEGGLLVGAYALLRPRLSGPRRRWGDRSLAVLVAIQVVSDFLLPPPPGPALLVIGAQATYLIAVLLVVPIDRTPATR